MNRRDFLKALGMTIGSIAAATQAGASPLLGRIVEVAAGAPTPPFVPPLPPGGLAGLVRSVSLSSFYETFDVTSLDRPLRSEFIGARGAELTVEAYAEKDLLVWLEEARPDEVEIDASVFLPTELRDRGYLRGTRWCLVKSSVTHCAHQYPVATFTLRRVVEIQQ